MDFKTFLLAPLVIAAGCGVSPVSSTPVDGPAAGGLPFQGTRYTLQMIGDTTKCGDVKLPQVGTSVTIDVTMKADSTGWTATPNTTSNGTLSLRLEPGPVRFNTTTVTGTAAGFTDDEGVTLAPGRPAPTGTRITFTKAVPMTGVIPFQDFANGTFDGMVVFSRSGVTATCASGAVTWTLNRSIG